MALGQPHEADPFEDGEEAIFSEINITPLTDIFLVMLIIFMVSASAAVKEQQERAQAVQEQVERDEASGLKVNLPSGATQELETTSKSLIVTISVGGEIAVNDQIISPSQIDSIFQRAFQTDKNTQVVIKGDKGVEYGTVVGVMERAKEVGLSKLAIQTAGGGGK